VRIPKTIDVKGKLWKVEYKWNLSDEGTLCDGLCDDTLRTIFINRATPKEQRAGIFMHELLHALYYELNLQEATFSEDVEEILVENTVQFLLDKFSLRLKRD